MKKMILGILIGLFLSTISVLALSLCNAKDIEYNASDTKWDVDTVEDALNDLYKSDNDSCHNVATPSLGSNNKLIPVIISDNGTITKVSKNNPNWYNYCEKKWANAVILNDGVSVPSDNSTISMSNIEAMFVWIPKYKYRLWNVKVNGLNSTNSVNQIHSIDIVFDTNDTTEKNGESCVTPKTSGNIGSCANGEYMTHPAFLAFGVNGFWVGKFETGNKTATTEASAQVTSNSSNLIVVKPNAFAWRYNTVRNMFEAAYNYERGLDSHMMKNTEWGAVAYLSHSKYGIDREININNNSLFKTGYSAIPDSYQGTYVGDSGDGASYNTAWNTTNGYRASTTGNITGVYDMSGGAYDYVAAYRTNTYGDSGFDKTTLEDKYNSKYYDSYNASSEVTTNQYMILGDATGEMGPFKFFKDGDDIERYHNNWYGDYSNFIESSFPWFRRGGGSTGGILAGQFNFTRVSGGVDINGSFRLVLALK